MPTPLPLTIATTSDGNGNGGFRVAHIGNSIQYYNDCPRLLERMLLQDSVHRVNNNNNNNNRVYQDSCLRGGATLPSLWWDGNGMRRKFSERLNDVHDGVGVGVGVVVDIGAPTVRDLLLHKNHKTKKKCGNDSDNDSDNDNKYWDFVVMNDHTQSPVRNETKQQSKVALETLYLPTIVTGMKESVRIATPVTGTGTGTIATPGTGTSTTTDPACSTSTSTSTINGTKHTKTTTTTCTVIFLQTAAYKSPVQNSSDLGSFDEYTELLIQGYDEYAELVKKFNDNLQQEQKQQQRQQPHTVGLKATVAPLGEAHRSIRREHPKLWSDSLYANDDFHPSPHGTWLQACLLYCIVTGGRKFDCGERYHGSNGDGDGGDTNDDTDNDHAGASSPPPAAAGIRGWWEKTARYMQPRAHDPLPLPTNEEAAYLSDVAHRTYLDQQEKERRTRQD